ncbi:hypothetical protein [Erythrobacter insulae]|nr:hypothetical protein [Erythrobacter insulae]
MKNPRLRLAIVSFAAGALFLFGAQTAFDAYQSRANSDVQQALKKYEKLIGDCIQDSNFGNDSRNLHDLESCAAARSHTDEIAQFATWENFERLTPYQQSRVLGLQVTLKNFEVRMLECQVGTTFDPHPRLRCREKPKFIDPGNFKAPSLDPEPQ